MRIRDKFMRIEDRIILVAVLLLITGTFLYLAIAIPENSIHWVGFGIFIVVLIGGIYVALTSNDKDMWQEDIGDRLAIVVMLIILIAVFIWFIRLVLLQPNLPI